jgi:hypothetical protein
MSRRPSYGSRPTNGRGRRTKKEMAAIRALIVDVLRRDHPQTVRQVYYRLTSAGAIAKTEPEYKTVVRLLAEMRRSGEVPYRWLADATRWMRKPTTFSSAEQALRRTAETYRRALWDDAMTVPEVWLEKEALAGVLVDVTREWDVPLMVCRGYPSISFLHTAAEAIHDRSRQDQRTVIYYFGDHDPSGVDIDRSIVKGIGESLLALEGGSDFGFEPDEEGTFEAYADFHRVAVTPGQIKALNLQTRPTKRHTQDYRAKRFVGDSVEVDAIQAATLRTFARQSIERHVDQDRLEVLQAIEAEERRVLLEMADAFNATPDDDPA